MPEDPGNPMPQPPVQNRNDLQARSWHMWCHFSALAGLLVPYGNILGPLLIWQIKKNEFPSVEAHAKAALNFQITVSIIVTGGLLVAIPLSFVCIGYLFIPLVIVVGVCGLVFSVIAGIKANDGQEYRYPYSFNLVT
jgi:uncharacterized Tic20 family protein